MHWKLTAINNQGARIWFYGRTKKEALEKFDNEYYRKGWFIHIGRIEEARED